ncbi:hypothetical protein ACVMFB_002459 [Bradyrhizobium sp. USDA 4522]
MPASGLGPAHPADCGLKSFLEVEPAQRPGACIAESDVGINRAVRTMDHARQGSPGTSMLAPGGRARFNEILPSVCRTLRSMKSQEDDCERCRWHANPSKRDFYVYTFHVDGYPFYVGIGRDRRASDRLRYVRSLAPEKLKKKSLSVRVMAALDVSACIEYSCTRMSTGLRRLLWRGRQSTGLFARDTS